MKPAVDCVRQLVKLRAGCQPALWRFSGVRQTILSWFAALPLAAMLFSAPVRVLIITGESDLPYHDWRASTPYLRAVLERTGRFDVKVAEEPRALNTAALAGYDVLVLNYNGPRWGTEAEQAVEDFVRGGKGMIAFHGVSYGPFYGQDMKTRRAAGTPWHAYADMVGVTWKLENIGHSDRHVFPVKWTNRNHPISRGLEPAFLANDELYHHMDHRPNVQVIASAFSDPKVRGTGKDEPVIWTVPFGTGRVLHMTLGHDLSAMVQPGFVAAFARGTEWAATGQVTLGAAISAHPDPKRDAVRVLVVTGGHGYPPAFYTLFEGYDDIRWSHAASQKDAFRAGMKDRFDVIVLHDMAETISDEQRANLQSFVDSGRGVVSIHHAIVDYTSWPWWHEQVVGGKYFTEATSGHEKSAFREGVDVVARPVKGMTKHPVLRGVGPIVVRDEVYRGMWRSPRITVLMETDHPESDPPVVYTGSHPKTRAVYIQLGHDAATFRHPGYRRLVHNAILWSAGRLE
ncbi:MAG TPA: ThuA domain-containing protein [Bryobacteraceae bacterium]|nr:ThuA domain-containing protein [Bryobacteraceae bacterium]